MAERGALMPISEAEYEAIEAAVMETARGRWFLSEFARRNRTADTTVLLDAIGRLEQAVTTERAQQGMERVRFDLMEMAKAIARTKTEISAIHPDQEQSRLTAASEGLDAIVRTTERATSDILEAAEQIQETAWTLREASADEKLCDELDQRATQIYTACSFQDLTAQRTGKIVNTLRYLEGRINAMIDIWGGDEAADASAEDAIGTAPQQIEQELSQSDVDTVIVDEDFFPAVDIEFVPALPENRRPVEGSQSDVDTVIVDEEFFPAVDIQFDPALPENRHPVEARPTFEVQAQAVTIDDADDFGFIGATPALPPPAVASTSPRPVVDEARLQPRPAGLSDLGAFADLDSLDTREKLRRFT